MRAILNVYARDIKTMGNHFDRRKVVAGLLVLVGKAVEPNG